MLLWRSQVLAACLLRSNGNNRKPNHTHKTPLCAEDRPNWNAVRKEKEKKNAISRMHAQAVKQG